MSNNVNPPPHLKIPEEFQSNPVLRPFFQQMLNILYQLWKRTGGTVDSVNELEAINTFETTAISGRLAGQYARIDELEAELMTTRSMLLAAIAETRQAIDMLEVMQMNYAALAGRVSGLAEKLDDTELLAYVIN